MDFKGSATTLDLNGAWAGTRCGIGAWLSYVGSEILIQETIFRIQLLTDLVEETQPLRESSADLLRGGSSGLIE